MTTKRERTMDIEAQKIHQLLSKTHWLEPRALSFLPLIYVFFWMNECVFNVMIQINKKDFLQSF